MAYVTPEQIQQARSVDLLTYLQTYAPDELKQISPNTYCTREHDSLKISNGKWCWFSRGIGGKSALDYLIKVHDYPFTAAVETILGKVASLPFTPAPQQPPTLQSRILKMPEMNGDPRTVIKYLTNRGIHLSVIDYCLTHKLLFESKKYHNAVFVGYDPTGKARYAALRGTVGNYKGEVAGSDKHYSFSIADGSDAKVLHLFECAIDLMSYATMEVLAGRDWRQDALLSLAGVYKMTRESVVPVALSQFLSDHPNIKTLCLHLDNDEIGRAAAHGIMEGLKENYEIRDQPPRCGKDMNEMLQRRLGLYRRKEDHIR